MKKQLVRVLKDPFILLAAAIVTTVVIWTLNDCPGVHLSFERFNNQQCTIHESCGWAYSSEHGYPTSNQ